MRQYVTQMNYVETGATSDHVVQLIEGRRGLTERLVSTKKAKEPPMPFDQIIRLGDGNARRAELRKHKPGDIKEGIKKHAKAMAGDRREPEQDW